MKFHFNEDAEKEFDAAVEFYEGRRAGLGLEFAREVYAAIALICRFPEAGNPLSDNTRRCLVRRFPFGVIYRLKAGYLEVVAVAGLRRRPDYWRKRR